MKSAAFDGRIAPVAMPVNLGKAGVSSAFVSMKFAIIAALTTSLLA
jgi:hypothetical protein